jgi:hypothetical protein
MNGKAKKTFDMLTKSILETAKAKAAVNKMTDEATKMLDADFQIQKIKNANLNEKKRYEKEAAEGGNAKKALTFYKEESDKRARIAIAEQEEIKKTSTNSINYLTNYAGGATAIAKTFTKGNDVSIPNGKLQPVPQEPKGKGSGKTNNTYDVTNYIAQESANIFAEYNKRVNETNAYYDKLKANKKLSDKEQQDLELQHQEALNTLKNDFQKNDVEKLSDFEHKLQQIVIDSTEDTKQKATLQAEEDKKQKLQEFDKETAEIKQRIIDEQKQLAELKGKATAEDRLLLEESIKKQNETLVQAAEVRIKYEAQLTKQIETVRNAKTDKPAKDTADKEPGNDDKKTEQVTDPSLKQQLITLKAQHDAAITNTKRTQEEVKKIEEDYAKKKADLEDKLVSSKIHAGDKYIDAVLKNSKKDSAIYKAAFMAKKATSIADVIISTKKGIIGSFEGYANLPFIGQALAIAQAAIIAGQGAASIADIAKQKPGFAAGGQYTSDGRGALLPGYSRIDNTNAYLRSGEAVVVSEAMRNPWARNLVSAINVAHGGRDFSMPNTSRGYAIGGIFTDGGNANRYYNQPVNDMKDMANTLAYQMLNNFPPIYVDVKDVNNQQNILAQTVNRVNL